VARDAIARAGDTGDDERAGHERRGGGVLEQRGVQRAGRRPFDLHARRARAVCGAAFRRLHSTRRCGALAASDTVWLGRSFRRRRERVRRRPNAQAVELARRDFAGITAGMTAPGSSTRVPAIGVIACNDAADARRAAAHLVDAGVQAVIGFQSGIEAIDLSTSLFIPNGVLAISAISTNPLVTTVPQPPELPRLCGGHRATRTIRRAS